MDMLDQCPVAVEERSWSPPRPGGPGKRQQPRGIAPGRSQRRGSPDVEIVALPCPSAHPADKPGQYLEPQVERSQAGYLAVGVGRDDIDPRVGQVAPGLLRLLDERGDPPVVVYLGDPAGTGIGRAEQQ